jgi:L-alanine-DL-glutamate epimerase-like enolase superfamily enzyme
VKITSVVLTPVAVKRRTGFVSRHVVVELATDEGLTGLGEMSDFGHLPLYMPDLKDLGQNLGRLLVGRDPREINALEALLLEMFPEEMFMYDMSAVIRCGVDVALHDVAAKSLGVPVSTLLGGALRDRLRVCYPIFRHRSKDDVAANIANVGERLKEGFDLIRLYAGLDLDADEAFLSGVRSRFGKRVKIKSLDFSNLVPWRRAVEATRRLAPYGIELIESPAPKNDLEGMQEVRRRVDLPVSEHCNSFFQARLMLERGCVDIFNVCTVFIGGIGPARQLFTLAETFGVHCLIGTTQELSIGTAAQAHLGASARRLDHPADPVGPRLYAQDVVKSRVDYVAGHLVVPDGPGLGMELDRALLKSLAAPLEWGSEALPAIQDRTAAAAPRKRRARP